MSLLIPLFFGLIIIAEKDEAKKKGKEEEEDYVSIIIAFYCIYAFLGIKDVSMILKMILIHKELVP